MTIRPPHPQNITTTLPTVKMVVEVSKANAVLTVTSVVRMLKSKVYLYKCRLSRKNIHLAPFVLYNDIIVTLIKQSNMRFPHCTCFRWKITSVQRNHAQ